MQRLIIGILSLIGFIGTIFMANYAITKWGIVPVGFGYMAPAAVYFAGLTFTFRDVVQLTLGRRVIIMGILLGALLSYLVSPAFALASGVAFLISEFVDLTIFTKIFNRNLTLAVLISGIVGAVVDSVIFLHLAFGNQDFLAGQLIGKTWMVLAALPFVLIIRRFIKDINDETSTSTPA